MSKALRDGYTRRERLERMDVHVGDAGRRLAGAPRYRNSNPPLQGSKLFT